MEELDAFFIAAWLVSVASGLAALIFFRFAKSFQLQLRSIHLIAGNALILILFVSIVFSSVETYYRFFIDRTDSFALNKLSERWGERHYQYNNLKARDNIDYAYRKSESKERLSFIGDSFTAGHGIENVDHRFANILRLQSPNTEIHVLAANGMETIDQIELVKKLYAEGYEFDKVILIYCLNDIAYMLPKTNEVYDRIYAFNDNLNFLERNSYWINTLSFRFFAKRDPDFLNYSNFVLEGYEGTSWREQQKMLGYLVATLEKQGAEVCVVTFPFLHDLEHYQFRNVHEKIDKFWKDQGVPHLDLIHTFDDMRSSDLVVNRYDAHPNAYAHSLAASAIGKFLNDQK